MTPDKYDEMAENMFKTICDQWAGECTEPARGRFTLMIATALRSAVEEAKEYWNKFEKGCGDPDCDLTKELLLNGIKKSKIYQEKARREARAKALEEAAKVADSYDVDNSQRPLAQIIAREIRALKESK